MKKRTTSKIENKSQAEVRRRRKEHRAMRLRLMGGSRVDSAKIEKESQAEVRLSPQEHHAMRLMLMGVSRVDSAKAMGIFVKTFDSHRLSVMAKFGARNTVDLVHIVGGIHVTNALRAKFSKHEPVSSK